MTMPSTLVVHKSQSLSFFPLSLGVQGKITAALFSHQTIRMAFSGMRASYILSTFVWTVSVIKILILIYLHNDFV